MHELLIFLIINYRLKKYKHKSKSYNILHDLLVMAKQNLLNRIIKAAHRLHK